MKRQQLPFGDHQIGQAEQAEKLCVVFGQSLVAGLLVPEQVLDDVKGVFDLGPDAGLDFLDLLDHLTQGAVAQQLAFAGLHCDVPLRAKRLFAFAHVSRGSAYYTAKPVSDDDLKLMRRIDELHLKLLFAGARMLRDLLRGEGVTVGRKHMTTLMRRMAIAALYRKPNTSKKALGRTIYPYLLRSLAIVRANRVWAMDLSYIPMARGFVYLAW